MKRKFTPFSISPNPVALFLTDALEGALFKIRYCVEYRQGFSAVLGDVGVGKSSLIRYAHAEFDAMEDVVSILIPTPNFKTEYAFIQTVTGAVGLPPRKSVQQHEREFEAWLGEQYLADKAVVLFIDESQKLSTKMLELVRSFLNFETNEAKLLQIILAGQMELRDRLRSKKLKPLYSRLINPTVLAPMSLSEVEKMIQHRCDYYKLQNPFPSPAIRRVYELSGGTPRDVLRICGTAYQMLQLMKIDSAPAELIDQAYAELQLELPQVEEEEAA
jgi:general secretion pathway protein A